MINYIYVLPRPFPCSRNAEDMDTTALPFSSVCALCGFCPPVGPTCQRGENSREKGRRRRIVQSGIPPFHVPEHAHGQIRFGLQKCFKLYPSVVRVVCTASMLVASLTESSLYPGGSIPSHIHFSSPPSPPLSLVSHNRSGNVV